MCLLTGQVQLAERCFSSSQNGITLSCHLYILFPSPNLGPGTLYPRVTQQFLFCWANTLFHKLKWRCLLSCAISESGRVSSQWTSLCPSVQHLWVQNCAYTCMEFNRSLKVFILVLNLYWLLPWSIIPSTRKEGQRKGKRRNPLSEWSLVSQFLWRFKKEAWLASGATTPYIQDHWWTGCWPLGWSSAH